MLYGSMLVSVMFLFVTVATMSLYLSTITCGALLKIIESTSSGGSLVSCSSYSSTIFIGLLSSNSPAWVAMVSGRRSLNV